MKKFKLGALIFSAMLLLNGTAFAGGIGYIDYAKVSENDSYAKAAVKEIDAKGLELQQYLVDREKEFKNLDTPLKKKNFEEKVASEFKAKEAAYVKLRVQKEEAVFNRIQSAAKAVMVEQKLDAIIDYKAVFVGGVDITDLVIAKLKGTK